MVLALLWSIAAFELRGALDWPRIMPPLKRELMVVTGFCEICEVFGTQLLLTRRTLAGTSVISSDKASGTRAFVPLHT